MKKEAIATRFGRIFGNPLAKVLSKTRTKPNHVTLFTLIPGSIAAYFFLTNRLFLGVLFFIFAHVLDCTDGALARLTNNETEFGRKLDFRIDIIRNSLMYFGLWYGIYYLNNQWFIGGAIIAAHYFVMVFGYMFIQYEMIFSSKLTSHDEGLITFMILPLLAMVDPMYFRIGLPIIISIQFTNYLILFLKQKKRPNIILNIKKTFKLVKDEKKK